MTRILLALIIAGVGSGTARAAQLDALDPTREWRVDAVTVSGNRRFPDSTLLDEILTRVRPWYQPWSARPVFDPITFESDLARLRRFYEARGYYDTGVSYDLTINAEASRVAAVITIREPSPVVIDTVETSVTGTEIGAAGPRLPETLPVERGAVFEEEKYQAAEQALRRFYLRRGHAFVEVQRRAELDLAARRARLFYTVDPGPRGSFGPTEIRGAGALDPDLIRREITWRQGELFSPDRIAATRTRLLELGLFNSVRIDRAADAAKSALVPMVIEVTETLHREVRVGVGYSTEDELRAQLEWRHLNFLGGGRQVSLAAKYAAITASGALTVAQPHFFTPATRAVAEFSHNQQDEDTFLLNATRLAPRIEHRFGPRLTAFAGYRFEFDKLNDIEGATVRALGSVRREGFVSGPTFGLVWNSSDDPLLPKRGELLSLTFDQSGKPWGGDFRYYKIVGEARKYLSLGWETVLASRLKAGFADAIGGDHRFPLFERFFAGGERSVRGYGRRRLGPLSVADDPIGGLSLLEGSLELRRPIWRELSGALFVDFGQVSLRSFHLPAADLRFSSGFGLSYTTPVGPVRLDVGFPFERPPGDRPWQIHFSIGAYF